VIGKMTSNIAKSEVVIAKILKLLMETGLKDTTVSFRSLDLADEYEPFFQTCFIWLIDEGLIRSKTNIDSVSSAFHSYGPVLTSRGFAVLGKQIEVNGAKMTIATAIDQTSRGQKSATFVGDFVGGMLGGFTKSISS
jgi:hypothetical protein